KEGKLIWEKLQDVASILKIIDETKLPINKQKLPQEVKELCKIREEYKKAKNFHKADEIRLRLREKGYIIEDTPYGQRVFRRV
ncbi:CysS/YqeB C-terminal domain-containing protein, partial [Desulfothermus okinawensis]